MQELYWLYCIARYKKLLRLILIFMQALAVTAQGIAVRKERSVRRM
jgi:hypothetical protein